MSFVISIAQYNFVVGDVFGNAQKIIAAARQAHASGARLLLTPELALCGYAAQDLYLRSAFLDACEHALAELAQASAQWPGLVLVVGHPRRVAPSDTEATQGGGIYNAASVLRDGRVHCTYAKQALAHCAVCDELRYFQPGHQSCVFEVAGVRMGLLIGEDAGRPGPARRAADAGAQLLLTLNACAWHMDKAREREEMMRQRVSETALPLVHAHLVGGQDEVVFDGRSFAMQADGRLALRAPGFKQTLACVTVNTAGASLTLETLEADALQPHEDTEAELWHALVLGVRDYVGKNGFAGALLGLSGGIDSAVVLAIAVDALGADKVHALMMPSPYTADISLMDARDMATRLGVHYDEIAIAPLFDAFKTALAPQFATFAQALPTDTTEENLQARIRGMLLMALSNKSGSVVLNTGNKSELAVGYCTLYGDMVGGFSVLKDVLKTRVFALARWRNAHDPYGTGADPIPQRIIVRAPSAELRADQTDQDSLPPYEVLDAIVEHCMEHDASVQNRVQAGFARSDVERVIHLIRQNEYKRSQAPVGICVSRRNFGKDWRYPITNGFRV